MEPKDKNASANLTMESIQKSLNTWKRNSERIPCCQVANAEIASATVPGLEESKKAWEAFKEARKKVPFYKRWFT